MAGSKRIPSKQGVFFMTFFISTVYLLCFLI